VREGGWLRKEVALVVKTTVQENGPFGIRIGLEWKDYINCSKPFNDRDLLLDYKMFLETFGTTTNHHIFPTLHQREIPLFAEMKLLFFFFSKLHNK
jgi:hypothetical protein